MEQYIQVVEEEFDDPVELPVDSDGTLILSTLSAQFPGATGLKYRNESTGNWRGLRVAEDKLQAPDGVWSETMVYCVVYPKGHSSNSEGKRKGEPEHASTTAKVKRHASEGNELQKTSDLVLLGLAYTAEENDIKEYFSTFGEVLMSQIKREHNTNKSKGFGFVRMADYEAQIKILTQRHNICGRWCEVKLPNSNANRSADSEVLNRKIFVGRCTEDVTQEDLRDYFSKFGEVVDVYIPKPFRAFAFVTFASPSVAMSLCGQDHIINNASVHISSADPKDNFRNRGGGGGGGGDDYRGNRQYGRRSNSPNRGGNNQMANNNMGGGMGGNMGGPMGGAMGGGMQGPAPGNMGNNMGGGGGFNMGNFPLNQAMLAALASQGMFGMPGMMGANNPMGGFQSNANQGGYNNQSPQNSFPYAGNGYNQGYSGGYNQSGSNQGGNTPNMNNSGGWASNSSSGDAKDLKGTSGWSNSKHEPMNSSWN